MPSGVSPPSPETHYSPLPMQRAKSYCTIGIVTGYVVPFVSQVTLHMTPYSYLTAPIPLYIHRDGSTSPLQLNVLNRTSFACHLTGRIEEHRQSKSWSRTDVGSYACRLRLRSRDTKLAVRGSCYFMFEPNSLQHDGKPGRVPVGREPCLASTESRYRSRRH